MNDDSILKKMLVEHPYYCSESNYYSNAAGSEWDSVDGFLEAFNNADVDMNLVFRWDIRGKEDSNNEYYVEIFMIHQRKGIFAPHRINSISEEGAKKLEQYLNKHWEQLQRMWTPFTKNA